MTIKRRVATILKTASTLKGELASLQKKCKHPVVSKVYRADTGNYDPSCDSYWIDCHCLNCDKRWSEDQ